MPEEPINPKHYALSPGIYVQFRNRWFLVNGNISVGMELASKERLNSEYNRECNLKCKA